MDVWFNKNTIVTLPDYPGQQIVVNGKVWSFDYSKRLGPIWLKKDGTDRKCQNPNKAVWKAFEQWQQRIKDNDQSSDQQTNC